MKALIIECAGATRVADVAEPVAAPGDVLLRIRTVGYCGSDLNTYRGLNPLVGYPRVPGHEIAATVEHVGRDVPPGMLAAGMDVTVVPPRRAASAPPVAAGAVTPAGTTRHWAYSVTARSPKSWWFLGTRSCAPTACPFVRLRSWNR